MTAIIDNVLVTGTPEEIHELLEMRNTSESVGLSNLDSVSTSSSSPADHTVNTWMFIPKPLSNGV